MAISVAIFAGCAWAAAALDTASTKHAAETATELPRELWGFLGGLVGALLTGIVTVGLFVVNTFRTTRQERAERIIVPRAQLDIQCLFYGPERGHFIADIRVLVENKGLLLARYGRFLLRVRGTGADAPIEFLNERSSRLRFPELLVREELLPNEPGRDDYTYTIEPGIKQTFTFTTKVPENIKYVAIFVMLVSKKEPIQSVEDAREYREERIFVVVPSKTDQELDTHLRDQRVGWRGELEVQDVPQLDATLK